jgi:hypothetical protein
MTIEYETTRRLIKIQFPSHKKHTVLLLQLFEKYNIFTLCEMICRFFLSTGLGEIISPS